ncbi:MAG: hypothetical protein ABIW17_02085, partial [Marmoricola sp.]
MRIHLWGWTDRTQVERVRLYTITSLYAIFWLLLLLAAAGTVGVVKQPVESVVMGLCTLALGVTGTLAMRAAVRLHPDRTPLPWLPLGLLLAAAATSEALVFLLPDKARFSAATVVVSVLAWGAGGFRDHSVQWFLFVAFPLLVLLP